VIALGSAVLHTHAAGNVGLVGDPSCPACRLSGRTLSAGQRDLLDEALDALGLADDPESLSRQALVEVILRAAEQQEERDRERLRITAGAHATAAREAADLAAARVDDPVGYATALADAARSADRAAILSRAAR
jgi:hypothetical protein